MKNLYAFHSFRLFSQHYYLHIQNKIHHYYIFTSLFGLFGLYDEFLQKELKFINKFKYLNNVEGYIIKKC